MIRMKRPARFPAFLQSLLPAAAVLMGMGCLGRTSLLSRAGGAPGGSANDSGGALGGGLAPHDGGDARDETARPEADEHGGRLKLLAGGLGGDGTIDGIGAGARFGYPTAIAADRAGNLFVADMDTVRRIVIATGEVTTLVGSPGQLGHADGIGAAARFDTPYGIAADGAGNLFVADTNNHTIRKVVLATGEVTTVAGSPGEAGRADGTGAAARFNHPYGIATDRAGNLVVTDSSNNAIRKVVTATGEVTTLASPARFSFPTGVTVDRAGNLVVVDTYNHTIRKVAPATGETTTVSASPQRVPDSDGYLPEVHGDSSQAIACDDVGNLFVADPLTDAIWKVVITTGELTTLAGLPRQWGSTDGIGASARFESPNGIASDGAGNLFVADTGNRTIRKVEIATGVVTTFAGSTRQSGSADGIGAAARFDDPQGLARDGEGNLLVADPGNHTIRRIVIATGEVTTLTVVPEWAKAKDGTGTVVRFIGPGGIVSDGAGDLFVTDMYCATLLKVARATGEVTTIAGQPEQRGSRDGTGPAARFDHPVGIAGDGEGNLFVADNTSHTIRKIVITTGEVTTVAGMPGQQGTADGIGPAARFNRPEGIASDGAGNLFVADHASHTIRRVVLALGEVTTLAGSPGSNGIADGVGPAARFDHPQGLATDGAGNLFVADTGNHTIRKIAVGTQTVTTVVGMPDRVGVALGPLPAALAAPSAVVVGAAGELYVSDQAENAILVATF
jgi:sugar lactone lactonase YvrE